MGMVAGVYGCILYDSGSDELKSLTKYYTFRAGRVAFASDHFEAEKKADIGKAVPIFENSVLLFDIDESMIQENEYPQEGTVSKHNGEYLYVNEVHFPQAEQFIMYCLVLPEGYYPTNFFSGKPHFAGHKGDKIAITWFFKDKITVKVGIAKDTEKTKRYTYSDQPTFWERHPKLWHAYEEAKDFAAKIVSNKLPNGS